MYEETNSNAKIAKYSAFGIGIAVIIALVIGFISEFYDIVAPSYKWLVISGWKLQEQALDDGFYLKKPFWTDIVKVFVWVNSTDAGENVENFRNIQPLSKDWQLMEMDIQINYSVIDPIKFRTVVWSNIPADIERLIFIPKVRKFLYDYTSEYTWKNLIQGWDRQELWQRMFESLWEWLVTQRVCEKQSTEIDINTGVETIIEANCKLVPRETETKISDYGIVVLSVNLRKVKPNDAIIKAIELTQKREQEVKIAKQNTEIEKQVADKAIEKKRWETESKKLDAEADAYKLRVEKEQLAEGMKAEAQGKIALANAERELKNALAGSKELIDYKRLDIDMKLAEAQLEFAKHYTGKVPWTVTIVWTEEAKGMRIFMGNIGGKVAVQE